MPEFDSWKSYDIFAQSVRRKARYVFEDQVDKFLQTVLGTSHTRKIDFPSKRFLWRAQLGDHWEEVEIDGDRDTYQGPLLPARMKPLAHSPHEGRVNPKGISCLYLTTWAHIDHAFSQPISADDPTTEYIPTQILAELFRKNGFDGVAYKSLLGEGFNVALFDNDAAKLVNCFLYNAKSVAFKFEEAGNPYSLKPR